MLVAFYYQNNVFLELDVMGVLVVDGGRRGQNRTQKDRLLMSLVYFILEKYIYTFDWITFIIAFKDVSLQYIFHRIDESNLMN